MRHTFKYNGLLLSAFENYLIDREQKETQTGDDLDLEKSPSNPGKLLANRFFSHNLLLNQFEQVLVSAKKNKPNKSEKISPGYYY